MPTATAVPATIPGYTHFGGAATVTGALANMLAAHGVLNPATKKPYTEAFLMGVGGGLGGGYWLWEICGGIWVVVGTRHLWQDDVQFLQPLLDRLQVPYEIHQTGNKKIAETTLRAALADGNPAFAWCDTASLPYYGLSPDMKKHLIQVVGVSGYDPATGTYLLDDRAQVPISIDAVALAEARATQPYMKQRLLVVKKPTAKADPAGAIREGLAAGAEYMLHPPIKNFGLPAIQKWAELANHPKDKKGWPQVLKPGSHLYLGQRAAFEAIELQGGSGGAMRGLFARTLEEAAAVCKIPELKKAAKRYDELAALWTSLADAALPDKVKPFKQTKELMRKKESLFLAKGAGAAKDLAKLQGQLDDLGESMKAGYPWGDADAKAFYQDMHDRLVQIHGAEESALGMVIDAL